MIVADETVVGADWCEQQLSDHWFSLMRQHALGVCRIKHGGHSPQLVLPDITAFRARLRAGCVGPLRFCHLETTPHGYIQGNSSPVYDDDHVVILQLAGISRYRDGDYHACLRPGGILLIGKTAALRIDHESNIEQLILPQPLARHDGLQLPRRSLTLCQASAEMEQMVFRWVADACLNTSLDACEAIDDVANTLARLLDQVLRFTGNSNHKRTLSRLTRKCIEDYIERNLSDPGLTVASIAAAFGCSVRTLHRAFGQSDGESLARHLWRMRVQACAAALRAHDAEVRSLTELALCWGFVNPTHFSSLFREIHGKSPSEYRREHMGARANQT